MSSTNISQAQDKIEVILTGIADKLEDVITEYRGIVVNLEDIPDGLKRKINQSCDQLEELRETISDSNQGLTVRVQCVNNICDNIDDMVLDIHDDAYGPTPPKLSEKIFTAFNTVKVILGFHDSEIPAVNVERPHQTQENNEHYFETQRTVLAAILAENPELNDTEL